MIWDGFRHSREECATAIATYLNQEHWKNPHDKKHTSLYNAWSIGKDNNLGRYGVPPAFDMTIIKSSESCDELAYYILVFIDIVRTSWHNIEPFWTFFDKTIASRFFDKPIPYTAIKALGYGSTPTRRKIPRPPALNSLFWRLPHGRHKTNATKLLMNTYSMLLYLFVIKTLIFVTVTSCLVVHETSN